ncbi:MAG: hypothetical protein LC793_19585 [Thermomicrobia bacterium]|nr:hypothetical protein [Thermomicrobia bacterium]MCA1722883.1 hypothetical protein [Thermomicrobia bacterium]
MAAPEDEDGEEEQRIVALAETTAPDALAHGGALTIPEAVRIALEQE